MFLAWNKAICLLLVNCFAKTIHHHLHNINHHHNAEIKNTEDKVPDITYLKTNTDLNAKINDAKGKIPSIINLTTTTSLTAAENV